MLSYSRVKNCAGPMCLRTISLRFQSGHREACLFLLYGFSMGAAYLFSPKLAAMLTATAG